MPTKRLVDADRKGRCDANQGWSMPTSKVEATENSNTTGKPEDQTVGTPEEAGISESTGMKNSQKSDSSGKH
jgi:hypothetical protein